ncbi:MAG: hypothetical protein IH867_11780, partial [Chloroflexi bacterium]|nr:hypothetical protein [Chloroflexota bacterium]
TAGRTAKGGTTSWEIRIPEGVREVIGRRLDRLSERCNEVLTIAAVIGRQFRFDVLKMLVEGTTEGQLLDALDEALSARIVEELPDEVGFYQFTHASMQETLTEELSHTRAVRTHARIAEALEAHYGESVEEHAAELVEHFAEAETVLGTEKLITYSVAAGHAAIAAHAYEAALPHFERAAALTDSTAREMGRAIILEGLGRALGGTSARAEMQQAVDALTQAFEIYVELDETEAAVRTALATEISHVHGPVGMADMLGDAIKLVAPGTASMARILAQYVQWSSFERGENLIAEANQAIEISESIGDPELRLDVLAGISVLSNLHPNYQLAESIVSKATPLIRSVGPSRSLTRVCDTILYQFMANGALETADEVVQLQLDTAQRVGTNFERAVAYQFKAHLAEIRGLLDEAIKQYKIGIEIAPHEPRVLIGKAILEMNLGDAGPINEYLIGFNRGAGIQEMRTGPGPYLLAYGSLWGRFLGMDIPLPTGFPARYHDIAGDATREPGIRAASLLNLALAAATGELDDDAVGLYSRLLETPLGLTWDAFLPRELVLGMLASRIGEHTAAEAHFEEFLRQCQITQRRPWSADGQAVYAELLLERDGPGDHDKATNLQDEAIAMSTELGMQPLLERVLSQRKILKA